MNVMAIGAHPDDVEFGCGGTLFKHKSDGDNIVHISFDTDPNEEPSLVKEHAEKNGLNWRFTVSPKEVTKKLIEEFGIGVVNAPSAPVILVCEDQTTRLLEKGVKSAEELKEEISGGC